jgi:hypothetical protein
MLRLFPPLRDYTRIETDCRANEPTGDNARLCLAVNRDWVEMENFSDFVSCKGPVVGPKNLGDQCWVGYWLQWNFMDQTGRPRSGERVRLGRHQESSLTSGLLAASCDHAVKSVRVRLC